MKRIFPRWCRLLMWEAAVIGFVFGHSYAVHHRTPEPPPVPDAVWESMAFDAEAYAIQIRAGMEPE